MAAALAVIPVCRTQAAPGPAAAPAPANLPPTRVAVANPSLIFAKMRETASLKEKLEDRRKELAAKEHELHDEIDRMIQDRDANYNPKHPKYIEICEQIDKKKADFQAWGLATKASVERQQKLMVKTLYDKIEAAVATVAQQNGYDLVIADGRQDIGSVEDISPEDLRRLLNTRAVLYSSKQVDITEMVLAVLDQQFAAAGGVAMPPPLPK
jgi:Skp family chaperone for outer membrane proteins